MIAISEELAALTAVASSEIAIYVDWSAFFGAQPPVFVIDRCGYPS